MTTPPAAGSGQALPARVVEKIDTFAAACREDGYGGNLCVMERQQLLAAIADAIEAARREYTGPRHTGRPDYCPPDLREDQICPACGASAENRLPCNAIHNRPRR